MTKYIGNKYGKFVVVKFYDFEVLSNNHKVARYLCHCECGNERIVRITSLNNGHTRSCGCSRRDSLKNKNVINDNVTYVTLKIYINGANEPIISNTLTITALKRW